MHRSFVWGMIAILAILLAPFAGVLGVSAHPVHADTAAPTATADDEIVVITSAGQLRVDDPFTPTGYQTATWNSGADTGWTVVAGGDFNGDGDDELVAARGSFIKVFDPVVPTGRAPVSFSTDLGSQRNVRLLNTGDFDADGKDEFAVMHYIPGTGVQAGLVWYDGGTNATQNEWTRRDYAEYGAMFQDMSVGNFNADSANDLVLVRNASGQRLVSVLNVSQQLGTIAEDSKFCCNWYAVAGGNLSNSPSAPGDEISLTRDGVNAATYGLILLRVVSGAFADLVSNPDWRWEPGFTSLSTGDLNGDGDDEVVMLRDPTWATTSLLMVNPLGAPMNPFEQATGYGSAAFRIVRTGDTDGDGKDEVVILKGDRYQIYTEPNVDSRLTQVNGSFYTPGTVSNLPFMALANVDGSGISLGPTLGVSPTSVSYSLDYGAVSPVQPLSITNAGTGSSFPWRAEVTEGNPWLLLNGASSAVQGTTPGQVSVSVKTDAVAPGTYTGKIKISTTDSSVVNSPVYVSVTLTLRDPGFAASPTQITLWQKLGAPTVTSEVKIVRPVEATKWTATALSLDETAVLMEKLAIGQATVTAAGPIIDGVMVPPPTWLVFTPDQGTTPSTMTVSAKAGTAAGTYHAVIVIAAGDPSLPEGVQLVYVTAVIADHFHFTFLPLITK